jgi:2-oxoisovalerate dehydrogenase E1 component
MPSVTCLSSKLKLELLNILLESRHGDLREGNLNRQGKGHFHVSGRGHEALAALSIQLEPDDYLAPYYRDRGLVLGRGVKTRQLALDYMAKRDSSSRGRQMPSHYSFRDLNIWSVPTPTAAQLLPACGMAWGMQLDGKQSLVVTTVGDAATRQGDFYEAVCFAQERKLPLLLVVEDNGFGISTPTAEMTPHALKIFNDEQWIKVDGWDVEQVYEAGQRAIAEIREGRGPIMIWAKMERLSSHTSSDDQAIYRTKEDLSHLDERDPLSMLKRQLLAEGELTEEEYDRLDREIKERVRQDYLSAEKAENPLASDLETNVSSPPPPPLDEQVIKPGKYRMGDVLNLTLRAGLDAEPNRVIFGEDVEDPKGGVFRLTQRLSTDFPDQVFNSPLAESTILGVACGLASYGKRPVFELQFIDFVYPGWNQLVTNLATLRWRTFGKWTCPTMIYAPYGAYLPGGSLWHSQANESAIAHFPGLSVVVPSTPEDAAGLLWTAMHSEDPVVFLVPKHLLWAEREVLEPVMSVPIGHARHHTYGDDVTLVAWGNTMEKALEAVAQIGEEVSVELIDLRSIVPWDHEAIEESVRKTGRLVVVQEDTENCSVGQMIISHITGRPDVWSRMVSPPVLVSKGNVMIGYNPIYEYTALPDTKRIVESLHRVMATTLEREGNFQAKPELRAAKTTRPPTVTSVDQPSTSIRNNMASNNEIVVKVPIMGEGLRSARVVSLHKQPGDVVKPDDVLCEVETDKAVYPIEAAFGGIFKSWQVQVDDVVEIGQEIGMVTADATSLAAMAKEQSQHEVTPVVPPAHPSLQALQKAAPSILGLASGDARTPALPAAITRRLSTVVPANMQLDVAWAAIRTARTSAKQAGLDHSPSLMLAWCVCRAMEKHAGFRCIVAKDGRILEQKDFDLGFAVALDGDRLGTAVIPRSNRLDFAAFATAYAQTLADTRAGKFSDVQSPINLTSLGAFGIEQATPIVVPPSMGTLFIGKAHERMINDGGQIFPQEVATLSLTFDHRVVNGSGAAAFLHAIKELVEVFKLPDRDSIR